MTEESLQLTKDTPVVLSLEHTPQLNEHSLCLTTTVRDQFRLLRPWMKFYEKVWNPSIMCVFVGCTENKRPQNDVIREISTMIQRPLQLAAQLQINDSTKEQIQNTLSCVLGRAASLLPVCHYIHSISLYKTTEHKYFFVYDTPEHYESPHVWDTMRVALFSIWYQMIMPQLLKQTTEWVLNVDVDDFVFHNDVGTLLKREKKKKEERSTSIFRRIWVTHSYEYVPTKVFDARTDSFSFVDYGYYYQHSIHNTLDDTDKRYKTIKFVNLQQWYSIFLHWVPGFREDIHPHSDASHVVTDEDTTEHTDDMMTFHFGVLDLPFFINNKPWTMSEDGGESKNKMTHEMDKKVKSAIFMNHHERSTMMPRFPENIKHVIVPDFAPVFL